MQHHKGVIMFRVAVLAVFVAGCASNPKTWVPTRYNAPPGVTQNIWETCWQKMEAEARKLAGSRYDSLTPKQKRCLVMRLTADCVVEAMNLLAVHAPEVGARCDKAAFQDYMIDAEYEQCGDHEGGANEVLDIYVYVRQSQRLGSGGALNRNVCPAN